MKQSKSAKQRAEVFTGEMPYSKFKESKALKVIEKMDEMALIHVKKAWGDTLLAEGEIVLGESDFTVDPCTDFFEELETLYRDKSPLLPYIEVHFTFIVSYADRVCAIQAKDIQIMGRAYESLQMFGLELERFKDETADENLYRLIYRD